MRLLKSNVLQYVFQRSFDIRPVFKVSRWFGNMGSSSWMVSNSVNSKQFGDNVIRCSFPSIVAQVDCVRQYHRLLVVNLTTEATEDVLSEHFSQFGMVLGVKIVRDKETLEPRGYGYVIFADKQALEHALVSQTHMINGREVFVGSDEKVTFIVLGISPSTNEKILEIYFSRYGDVLLCNVKHDPNVGNHHGIVIFKSERHVNPGLVFQTHVIDGKQVLVKRLCQKELSLYVGNLAPSTTDQSLSTYFSQFGNLLNAAVRRDRSTGQSRGFGYVCFSSQQEFDCVLRSLPHVIDGRKVVLDYCTNEFTLFVCGLPSSSTEKSLKQYFEQYGPVYSCNIARDKQTNQLRDFGWVVFSTGQGLNDALAARPLAIDGKPIIAQCGRYRGRKTCSLIVGRLSSDTTNEMLYDVFSKYGSFVQCNVRRDEVSGQSKGYGYVSYSTQDELSNALLARPHVVDGRVVDVEQNDRNHSALKSASLACLSNNC